MIFKINKFEDAVLEKLYLKAFEELKEFFALMRSAPSLGESKPYCLDVGHFIASRSGIHVETYERFRIR